ncbi:MAG TPA: undecaprenyl-diphosphate phosphatase [Candidatus Saccharimonas sp.]|nr:undecaprenyl-diphosphate phosphatase [Candidatus Saccharimonas sp.]
MQVVQAIILGLVQGLTEFIPVSSSGHLIVVGHFLGFQYSGLAFDTALDVGTLLALVMFFARDFWELAHDLVMGGPHRKLAWYIVLGTIPAVVVGVLIEHLAETAFRSSQLVAVNLIWVGVVMWAVDRWSRQNLGLDGVTLPRALGVGLAQAVALVPGVSRSGITITTGRLFGLDRVAATRFSFLLSAPVIAGATAKVLLTGDALSQMAAVPMVYVAGVLAAFASGYLAIKFLLAYLAKHGLGLFAAYRIVLGVLILVIGLR